jgi:lysozyme
MIEVNEDRMVDQLLLHEGEKLTPYVDTLGNWTVGTGYNLEARGVEFLNRRSARTSRRTITASPVRVDVRLTQAQSRLVLRADIARVEASRQGSLPDYLNLNEVRRRVVLDMAFNLGFRALGFKAAIAAIKARNFSQASRELYKSKWAYQVGTARGRSSTDATGCRGCYSPAKTTPHRRSSRATKTQKCSQFSRAIYTDNKSGLCRRA